MPKRSDNIHKRKDGRWEGRYQKGRNSNGALLYGSVYGRTYYEVKEKLKKIPPALPPRISFRGEKYMFGEVADLWLESNRIRFKGGTVNKYSTLIDAHIKPELGCIPIEQLDSVTVNSFLSKKLISGRIDSGGELSPSYVRSIMLIVNSVLKYAADEGMCSSFKSPINKPTVTKKELRILSLEEQKTLERMLLSELDRTKAGILIALYAGMRIGEICALAWEDVDLKNSIIRVRHTVARVKNDRSDKSQLIIDSPKTRASSRDIPIASVLHLVLSELLNTASSQYVISENAGFVNPRTFEYRYHRTLKRCGLKPINFHALRHTFATRCIEAGVDVKSLSEILGHANVGITLNTYVHPSMETKRNQLEKMAALSACHTNMV